jgi:hypothetical protein
MTTLCINHPWLVVSEDDDVCVIAPNVEARFGCLCGPCYGRVRWMLRQTPQLVAHIRAQVTPTVQAAAYGAKVGGTPERRLPMREQAVEDADDLFSQLANWMLTFADVLHVTGPYATLPYRGEEDGATRLPPFALDQAGAHRAVENLVEWYEKRELAIVTATAPLDVRAWIDDLTEYTGRLHGRYPDAPRKPRSAKPRVCPVCEERAVVATFLAAGAEVACTHCGWTADEHEVDQYVDWSE